MRVCWGVWMEVVLARWQLPASCFNSEEVEASPPMCLRVPTEVSWHCVCSDSRGIEVCVVGVGGVIGNREVDASPTYRTEKC